MSRESATSSATSLQEDLKVAHWILVTSAAEGRVRALEARTLVRSLWVTLHASDEPALPLVDMSYGLLVPAAHAVNVALLSMALAERLGEDERVARELGMAALLKDIGAARLPQELTTKPDALTEDEQRLMRTHPVEGARLLIRTQQPLELAAVVAYEHHVGAAGGGYPRLRHEDGTHAATRLVQIADVFCALATTRAHRPAWQLEQILAHIEERAGIEFDAPLTERLLPVLRELSGSIVRLRRPDEPLPLV